MNAFDRLCHARLLATIVIGSASTLTVGAAVAHAQTGAEVRRSIELAPAFTDDRDERQAVGVFFRRTCRIETTGDAVVIRAARAGEPMRTDDVVRVLVERPDGRIHEWRHDFRDPVGGSIAGLRAQRLDDLFMRGVHTVTITLIDLRPPRHSSGAYALSYVTASDAAAECFDPEAVAVSAPGGKKTIDGAERCTAYDEFGASARSAGSSCIELTAARPAVAEESAGALSEHRTSLESRATPSTAAKSSSVNAPAVALPQTQRAVRETAAPGAVVNDEPVAVGSTMIDDLRARGWVLVPAIGVATAAAMLWRRRRGGPVLSGLLSVQDRANGERIDHVDLVQYGARAWLCGEPLQLKSGAARPAGALGRLDVDASNTCRLTNSAGVERVLRDGDVVLLADRLRVTYRAPAAYAPVQLEATS